jgi:hypothetical protein
MDRIFPHLILMHWHDRCVQYDTYSDHPRFHSQNRVRSSGHADSDLLARGPRRFHPKFEAWQVDLPFRPRRVLLHHLFLRSLIRLSFARMPSSLAQTYLGSLLRNSHSRIAGPGFRRTLGVVRTTSISNSDSDSDRSYTSITPRSRHRYRVQPNHPDHQKEWQTTTASSDRQPQSRSNLQNDFQTREKFARRRRKGEGSDLGAQGGFMGMSWKASLSLSSFLPLPLHSSLSSSSSSSSLPLPLPSFSFSFSDYDYHYDHFP